MNTAASIHTLQPAELDYIGQMMLTSARVFASAGKPIPAEYISRMRSHKKTPAV